MVYEVINQTVQFIKAEVSRDIIKIHYFSDGCAAQYKNCKHFCNLCLHSNDFSVSCTWSFFATSHGKSPCDGLGGTIKRLAARASLQRPIDNQILSAIEMFKFCEKEIDGITCIYIKSETEMEVRQNMQKQYKSAKTIPGTRSYHQYQVLRLLQKLSLKRKLFQSYLILIWAWM